MASGADLSVFLISARHLPHVSPCGTWDSAEGIWVPEPGRQTCNPYVRVELVERGAVTAARESRTLVDSYQPKWEQARALAPSRARLGRAGLPSVNSLAAVRAPRHHAEACCGRP